MNEGIGAPAEATPVDHALDQLTTALDHLVKVVEDGGLDLYDNGQVLGFLQSFERMRNRMALVDHRVIVDGNRRALPDALSQPSMRQVLVQLLRLSPGEAARRVTSAEACAERVTMLGEALAPVRPHLAAAQRDGLVSPEQVHIVAQALHKVDRSGFDQADIETGERLLTDFATTFGAKDLKRLADQTVDAIDPDGTVPDEQLSLDRRHFSLRRGRDGMYSGDFRLTASSGARLSALLGPLAVPRVDSVTTPDDPSRREVDTRTFGQRMHDALDEVCVRVLQAGDVVGMGGTPATVIVTVTLEDLVQRLGYGTSSDGALIRTRELLRLAHEADIVPAVMSAGGAVLELGRTRRIASNAQTHALIARDHGCSFPGCDRPPEWTERHHIVEWADGGSTDLDNLTLLCRYHHHHFASRGWTCRINDQRLPEWRPPRWVDRDQRPLVNSRIMAHLRHRQRRRRDQPSAVSALARPGLGVSQR
jgi:hypothetical protein